MDLSTVQISCLLMHRLFWEMQCQKTVLCWTEPHRHTLKAHINKPAGSLWDHCCLSWRNGRSVFLLIWYHSFPSHFKSSCFLFLPLHSNLGTEILSSSLFPKQTPGLKGLGHAHGRYLHISQSLCVCRIVLAFIDLSSFLQICHNKSLGYIKSYVPHLPFL